MNTLKAQVALVIGSSGRTEAASAGIHVRRSRGQSPPRPPARSQAASGPHSHNHTNRQPVKET
jgi:hypothetical protein